jgi:hypothetical protein
MVNVVVRIRAMGISIGLLRCLNLLLNHLFATIKETLVIQSRRDDSRKVTIATAMSIRTTTN